MAVAEQSVKAAESQPKIEQPATSPGQSVSQAR
jgi:hypothetical protein